MTTLQHRSVRPAIRLAYNTLWLTDHIFGPRIEDARLFNGLRQRIRRRAAEDMARGGKARTFQVESHENLTHKDFVGNYRRHSLPVIFKGAARHWECVRTWSPEFFAERYGDDPVTLLSMSKEELGGAKFKPIGDTVTVRELIQRLRAGDRSLYWRFSPLLHNHPELQEAFDSKWLESFREKRSFVSLFQLFVGAGGTNTTVHNAPASNLFVQVYGKKQWLIYPPDYNAVFDPPIRRAPYFFSRIDPDNPDLNHFPGGQYLDAYEAMLEPGDVLYVPPYYWHQVVNPTDSIGVGYRWFAPSAAVRACFTQLMLTLLATNPPVFTNALNARRKKGSPDLVTAIPKPVSPFLQG